MVRHLLALAVAGCIVGPSLMALDLSPTPGFRMLEGFKIPVITMRDGKDTVRWQPPAKWTLGGDQAKLILSSPDFAGATMELQVLLREAGGKDALTTPAQQKEWLRRFLPRDAQDVTVLAENASPFTLKEQPSREVIFQFVSQARRLTSSISFVDLSVRERLVLDVTALQPDFAPVHEAAMASMFSWTWAE
jgi:hypothetical protein